MKPRVSPEPLQKWTEIALSSNFANQWLGTPSLLIDSVGTFWATHDYFYGDSTAQNQTTIYKSTDSGVTWSFVRTITGCYWAKIFEYSGDLYLLGIDERNATTGDGKLTIFKSTDDFATAPSSLDLTTNATGLSGMRFVTAANTHVIQDGYFLIASVNRKALTFAQDHDIVFLWADLTDLMTAANWGRSTALAYSQSDNLAGWSGTNSGWLEPNLVNDGGTLKIIARMHTVHEHKAAKINVSWTPATPTGSLSFTPTFVSVPGGSIQFTPVWHSGASKWLIVSNHEADFTPGSGSFGENDPNQRRWEQWICSASTVDGTWTPVKRIHGSNYEKIMGGGVEYCGFQYASIQLSSDEDTLYVLNRTSWQGANTEHNSNRITFETYRGINALLGV